MLYIVEVYPHPGVVHVLHVEYKLDQFTIDTTAAAPSMFLFSAY